MLNKKLLYRFLIQEKDMGISFIPKLETKKEKKDKFILLNNLEKKHKNCKNCHLWKTRKNIVFGEGNPYSELVFVGEGPGYDEDRTGRPFVGRAGQLLTKIINAMGLKRDKVYITNIVKCHPLKDPSNPDKRGNDRPPNEEEINMCIPILKEQLRIIQPKFICCLGAVALKTLLKTKIGISKLRGQFFDYYPSENDKNFKIELTGTFHPAYLLRNPSAKKDCWEDIKKLMKKMGLKIPK